MFRLAALLTVVFAASAVAAPVPKEIKKPKADLNGVWEVTEWHSNGNKVNSNQVIRWTIDGEKLTIERNLPKGGGGFGGKVGNAAAITLVPPKDGGANALDYVITYPNGQPPRTLPGVFEQDGDTMKYAYGTNNPNGGEIERPADCKPGKGSVVYFFKRVEEGK